MIIIQIIILYFIQITHTDDFPSTGRPTRLVCYNTLIISTTIQYNTIQSHSFQLSCMSIIIIHWMFTMKSLKGYVRSYKLIGDIPRK